MAALAAVAAVAIRHGHELTATLGRVSPAVFAIAVALHLATLFARADAWRVTLLAIDRRRIPWRTLQLATAVGFLAGTAETHLSMPARLAALRRLAPGAAPRVPQMLLSDIPMMAIEACCAAVLLVVAAGALPTLPWWALPVVLIGAVGGLLAVRVAHERLPERPLLAGLAILGTPGLRERLAGLTATTVALTLSRIAVILAGCHLARGPEHAILVYLAVSVLGLLPIGPASNPAATLVAAGAPTVGAATAAGLAIAATSIAAVAVYVLIAAARGLTGRGGGGRSRPSAVRAAVVSFRRSASRAPRATACSPP